jgi:hypothetical protein
MGRKTVSFFELSEEKEEKYPKKGVGIKSMLLSDSPFKDDRKSAIYRLCMC